MKSVKTFTLIAAAAAAFGPLSVPAADTAADYEITVTSLWTAERFPLDYPKAGLLTGPHFSGVIGASHNGTFDLFRAGAQPTPGLERLSEEGKHSPLDGEIKAAIAAGTAGALFESDPIKDFGKSVTSRVHVTAAFPDVSAVAMIAPSPDWFAGVSGVRLMVDGVFVAEKTVDLYAWDAGGDTGATYAAADKDARPKQATTLASKEHFGARPVARITFRRI